MAVFFIMLGKTNVLALSSIVSSPTPTVSVDYTLPYPGILPDHPLYFLKVIRDEILGWFINDPIKKVEFELLMADKRIKMAEILFEEGKNDLSLATVSRGEKYLSRAIDDLVTARKNNPTVGANLTDKLKSAVLKHKEIVSEIMSKVNSRQNEWQEIVTLINSNVNTLNRLK